MLIYKTDHLISVSPMDHFHSQSEMMSVSTKITTTMATPATKLLFNSYKQSLSNWVALQICVSVHVTFQHILHHFPLQWDKHHVKNSNTWQVLTTYSKTTCLTHWILRLQKTHSNFSIIYASVWTVNVHAINCIFSMPFSHDRIIQTTSNMVQPVKFRKTLQVAC